ncbi:MAG TPA: DUF4271 domain-containing protein [Cyclobacteriaceae bacterium]|nr:DUF4271 domain-containing protein [Cyclobacteriaceae bacterium]
MDTKDLQSAWLVYNDGSYFQASHDVKQTIYIDLDASEYSGKYLSIASRQPWSIFINGKLKGSYSSAINFNIDSLRIEFHSSNFLIAIHKERINSKNLLTKIISTKNDSGHSSLNELPRPDTYFRDFALVGILVLLIFLVAMNQLTKLDMSFFSVKKLFSSYESEDSQLYPRIASGSNMLFFIFCSLTLAFYMSIIFHFTAEWFDITWYFSSSTFWTAVWQWIKFSLVLLMAFVLKMLLVFFLSRLFGFKELFGFQIFSWIRILMIMFGFMNVILVLYFISRGSNPEVYIIFFWLIALVLLLWVIMLLVKVARRTDYSLFHIFSYLCATEIIPLLISIKLLYH